jgi:AAA domain-containing protein
VNAALPDDLAQRLDRWAENEIEGDDERAAIQHVEHEQSQQPPPPAPFHFRRLDNIEPGPPSEIVQGLGIDKGAVVAIVGTPNSGKTALAVSLVLAVASRAERWMGLKVAGGPVIYFAPEAPASVTLRARAAASRLALPRPPAFYLSSGVPALGGELTSSIDERRVGTTIDAVQSAEGECVRLALFDTLASCLGDGDENGDGMLRLVRAAKWIAFEKGVCAVLVHHPSKGDGTNLRGHGSLAAACDSIVRIEADELSGVRTATLVKARDHATGVQLRFELEPVVLQERDSFGDPLTTIVVRPTTQRAAPPRPSGRRQQELLSELERRYRTGEHSWDEATVRKCGRDLGMPRNSPADALKALVHAGYVTGSPASLTLKFPPEECTK